MHAKDSPRAPSSGLIVSSVVAGAFTPGIVPLVLGRVNELLPHNAAAQKAAWRTATTSFAILQAAAAYGLSYLFVQTGEDYRLLFMLGASALSLAFAVDLVMAVTTPEQSARHMGAAPSARRRSSPPVHSNA